MLKLLNNLLVSGIAFVWALVLNSQAQGVVTLNSGDSWTYHFTNLDFVETRSGSIGLGGGGSLSLAYSTTGETPEYLCELFEGQVPAGSFYAFSQPVAGVFLPSNAWSDLEGTIRFSVLSGSYTLESLVVSVHRPVSLSSYDVFRGVVIPVPEPTFLSLLLLFLIAAIRVKVNCTRPTNALSVP
jgi:hypothetical protein